MPGRGCDCRALHGWPQEKLREVAAALAAKHGVAAPKNPYLDEDEDSDGEGEGDEEGESGDEGEDEDEGPEGESDDEGAVSGSEDEEGESGDEGEEEDEEGSDSAADVSEGAFGSALGCLEGVAVWGELATQAEA